jgi:hypothetical protein
MRRLFSPSSWFSSNKKRQGAYAAVAQATGEAVEDGADDGEGTGVATLHPTALASTSRGAVGTGMSGAAAAPQRQAGRIGGSANKRSASVAPL